LICSALFLRFLRLFVASIFFFATAGARRLLALTMAAAISYLPRRACRYGVAL
jgi:hypothetical protein